MRPPRGAQPVVRAVRRFQAMELVPEGSIAIVVAICAACFVLLAWVWAKVLDDPSPRPRRRGIGRVQLAVLSVLLLASSLSPRNVPPESDAVTVLQLHIAAAVALIAALLLFNEDLRRRADDPRDLHRVTGWGAAAIGAGLLAAVLAAVEVSVAAGDGTYGVAVLAVVLGIAVLAVLDFRLALAIQWRWARKRAEARGSSDRTAERTVPSDEPDQDD